MQTVNGKEDYKTLEKYIYEHDVRITYLQGYYWLTNDGERVLKIDTNVIMRLIDIGLLKLSNGKIERKYHK